MFCSLSGSPQANTDIVCSGRKCLALNISWLCQVWEPFSLCILYLISHLKKLKCTHKARGRRNITENTDCSGTLHYTTEKNAIANRQQRFLNCSTCGHSEKDRWFYVILKMLVRHQKLEIPNRNFQSIFLKSVWWKAGHSGVVKKISTHINTHRYPKLIWSWAPLIKMILFLLIPVPSYHIQQFNVIYFSFRNVQPWTTTIPSPLANKWEWLLYFHSVLQCSFRNVQHVYIHHINTLINISPLPHCGTTAETIQHWPRTKSLLLHDRALFVTPLQSVGHKNQWSLIKLVQWRYGQPLNLFNLPVKHTRPSKHWDIVLVPPPSYNPPHSWDITSVITPLSAGACSTQLLIHNQRYI